MVFALVAQTEIAGLEGWPFAKSHVFVTVDQPDTAVIALPRVSLAPTNLARLNPVVGRARTLSPAAVRAASHGSEHRALLRGPGPLCSCLDCDLHRNSAVTSIGVRLATGSGAAGRLAGPVEAAGQE